MNKIVLLGRLCRDPEMQTVGEKQTLKARYTLAVNRNFKSKGKDEITADFIPVVAMGKLGEFAEKYFRKGQQVSIVGRLQIRSYEDNNGIKKYFAEVIAEEQYFAEGKKESTHEGIEISESMVEVEG